MSKHRLPKHIQAYVTPWGKQVYYLRKPGRSKIRLQVADDVAPWSPAFLAALEAAADKLSADTRQIINRPPAAGTVNAALVSYYDSASFKTLGRTTQQNRRAILERQDRARRQAHRRDACPSRADHHQQIEAESPARFQEGNEALRPPLHQYRPDVGRSAALTGKS
jgi:hypothetical protein